MVDSNSKNDAVKALKMPGKKIGIGLLSYEISNKGNQRTLFVLPSSTSEVGILTSGLGVPEELFGHRFRAVFGLIPSAHAFRGGGSAREARIRAEGTPGLPLC